MSFRKPHGTALLRAAIALAAAGGTQLVFDDSADRSAIVTPTDQLETLAAIWLWAQAPTSRRPTAALSTSTMDGRRG